jgi:hypothetical protein
MCSNIKRLYNVAPPPIDDEVRAAALQYIRKISGMTRPSAANAEAFDRAVDEIAGASARLLDALVSRAPPVERDVLAERTRARYRQRDAS